MAEPEAQRITNKQCRGLWILQVLMFSATLHSAEVRATAENVCQNPTLVDLKVAPINSEPGLDTVIVRLKGFWTATSQYFIPCRAKPCHEPQIRYPCEHRLKLAWRALHMIIAFCKRDA